MKINQSLLPLILSILFLSCAKEEDTTSSIPYALVDIDINIKVDYNFDEAYFHKTYNNGSNTGYAGVVVISNEDASKLWAYDLCCPNEAPLKNAIEIEDRSPLGKCPTCKSVFYLADGRGYPTSGPAKTKLKSYSVIPDGNTYRIRN